MGPSPLAREPHAIATDPQPAADAPAADLVRIVYVSAAARPLGQADLDAIERSAARHNAARGLTGLLLFGSGRFYGVLEGPRRRVFSRMERIVVDPRHRNLVVLREEAIDAPRFANWTFGSIPEGDPPGGEAALDSFILGLAGRM